MARQRAFTHTADRVIGPAGSARRTLLGQVLQWGFMAALAVFVLVRLNRLGWDQVLSALPTTPWFYALFALRYMTLPLADTWIYGRLVGRSQWRHVPVFIRKKIFNFDFFSYSGEAYFTFWARREWGRSTMDVLRLVKDVNLTSAAVSNLATVLFLTVLLIEGSIYTLPLNGIVAGAVALIALDLGLILGLVLLRRRLLSSDGGPLAQVTCMHAGRFALTFVLQLLMYAVALPSVSLSTWFLFLTLYQIVNRLPLVPNKNLTFFAAALPMAGAVQIPEAALAGVLLAFTGVQQATTLSLLLIFSTGSRKVPAQA
ncbi:MAG: hypothetical protein ACFB22_08340 [Rhodothalassiaceae bacterium]